MKTDQEGIAERLAAALQDARIYGRDESGKKIGTLEGTGKILGIGKHQVGKILSGDRGPSEEVIWRAAKATGYCSEWLATGRGPKRMADLLDLDRVKPEKRELLRGLYEEFSAD